jgi:hypothetical protein
MLGKWTFGMLTACIVSLSAGIMAPVVAQEPPYALLLRSREAVVTPERSRDAQTGGGFIQVTQLQPNVVMALFRGAVAAGTGHHEGSAAMHLTLNQDFEVVATRAGLRPPRLVVAGWVIGALETTIKGSGMAEHSPACASVGSGGSGGEPIINLCIKPHGVGGGENLLVNDRVGPIEAVVLPGCFTLNQTFAIRATENKSHCHTGGAAAVFDPDPKMDSRWNEVLKPFRAVPPKDFGYRVIVRVVEDVPPPLAATAPGIESLPAPAPGTERLPAPKPVPNNDNQTSSKPALEEPKSAR